MRIIDRRNNMPTIRPSSDLRNNYNEISTMCHEFNEPVYITKNGKGDLAVMSIETYEKIIGKLELFRFLDEGMEDIKNGNYRVAEEVFSDIENRLDK